MRQILTEHPFLNVSNKGVFKDFEYYKGAWPARWIHFPELLTTPFAVAYFLNFTLEDDISTNLHVTADERYMLYIDGIRVGRGSERGDRWNWFFESYRVQLSKGSHSIVAMTWALGAVAPFAQVSIKPGFLCACDDEEVNKIIATGLAPWRVSQVKGVAFNPAPKAWLAGATVDIDGNLYPWGIENGSAGDWLSPRIGNYGVNSNTCDGWGGNVDNHLLKPAALPPMMERPLTIGRVCQVGEVAITKEPTPYLGSLNNAELQGKWQDLLTSGKTVRIEKNKNIRVLIDLENYYCAYNHFRVSGGNGATFRISWCEALYTKAECSDQTPKDNRDVIEGKYFKGVDEQFFCDGGQKRVYENFWWKAGRYLELYISTKDDVLDIEELSFIESRYPIEPESSFDIDDERYLKLMPIMIRSLQMCSNETFYDCPFYEQLMYVGDTRLEALMTLVLSHDDRLVRKALKMFDASRLITGLTESRYPARTIQVIPPFSLWWCAMVSDYAMWRDDKKFIISLMPGVRGVLETCISYVNKNDLVTLLPGWNFMDWTRSDDWIRGVPPTSGDGVSAMINWQFVNVLRMVSKVESWLGEKELCLRYENIAGRIADAIENHFWNEERGLYSDDSSKTHYSEHTQCLAMLSGYLTDEKVKSLGKKLVAEKELTRTTIYFSYYLFEAFRVAGQYAAIADRMPEWFDLNKMGMKTTRENPEPTRSDCHAWGSHPLIHYYTTISGIRPSEPGFRSVNIHPAEDYFNNLNVSMVHPDGMIKVNLSVSESEITGTVSLPSLLSGKFSMYNKEIVLVPGENRIQFRK